jgi:nitrite reductase (NO-forming)
MDGSRIVRTLAVTMMVGLLAAGCSGAAKPGWTYAPAASGSAPVAAASAAPAAPAAAVGSTLKIESFDLGFTPATLEVPAAARYAVELTNTGQAPHDITFPAGETAHADPGETARVEVDVPADGITFICSIPGHEQGGMKGEVKVAGSTSHGGGDDTAAPCPRVR